MLTMKRPCISHRHCPHCDKLLNVKTFKEHKRLFFDRDTKLWHRVLSTISGESSLSNEENKRERHFTLSPSVIVIRWRWQGLWQFQWTRRNWTIVCRTYWLWITAYATLIVRTQKENTDWERWRDSCKPRRHSTTIIFTWWSDKSESRWWRNSSSCMVGCTVPEHVPNVSFHIWSGNSMANYVHIHFIEILWSIFS